MRILIADDHPVVRSGLKQIVSEMLEVTDIEEAADGHMALKMAIENPYDLILLDVSLPGKNGLDVLKELKPFKPELPVLVVSIHSEKEYAIRVLKAGASGFVAKDASPEQLQGAIRKVARGGKYISPGVADLLADSLHGGQVMEPHEKLSDREYEVLRLIASGLTVKQIADRLSLSDKTVSTYRYRILEKMGMESNAELVRYTIENGLLN